LFSSQAATVKIVEIAGDPLRRYFLIGDEPISPWTLCSPDEPGSMASDEVGEAPTSERPGGD
jgi:hypothetical protein